MKTNIFNIFKEFKRVIIVQHQVSNFSWQVQATFQCDDDDVHFMVSTSYISM